MFKFNKDMEYAMISLMEIAREGDTLISTRRISERYSIPYKLLAKILQKLSSCGLVKSVKGPKGGYKLAAEPCEISLKRVLDAVRGPESIADCMTSDGVCVQDECGCTIKPVIQLFHDKWVDFVNNTTLYEFMESRLLTDVSGNKGG